MAEQKGITNAIISIRGVMSPSVKKSVEKATKSIKGLKVACIASATAIAGGVTVATKKLLDLGSELDSAYDTIRIGTGATGKTLEGLKKDFEKVFASVPTSSENASQAIADLNTRLGLNGKNLQEVAKQAIYLSENLGAGELTAVVEKSSRAMQSWGISEDKMTEKMDYLFKVSQSTGIGFTDLAEKAQRYGATFQSLGYDFESASTMIGQMVKSGIDVDSTLAGMRTSLGKLTAKGLSASEGFEQYYQKIKNAKTETEAMSLASEIFGTKNGALMAKAIRDGKLEIGALTKELTNSKESIEGASLDTMDFAEKMQILKNKMKVSLAPLGNSVFDSMNALMPLAEKGINTLTKIISKLGKKLPDIIPTISNVVKKAIKVFNKIYPIVTKVVKKLVAYIQKTVKKITPIVEKVIGKIKNGFEKIRPTLENLKNKTLEKLPIVFEKIGKGVEFLIDNFDKIVPIIAGVVAGFATFKTITGAISVFGKVAKTVDTVKKSIGGLKTAFGIFKAMTPTGWIVLAIGALVTAGIYLYQNWDTVKEKFIAIGNKISEVFSKVKETVGNVINNISEKFPLIGIVIDTIKAQITSSIDAIKGIFSGIIDFVKNVFTGNWKGAWDAVKSIFSSIFDGLAGIVKAPLNAIVRIVNKVIDSINGVGFTIPDWVPLVGGKAFKLDIPQIPTFAKGGIATTPSICGEGGYPEYVISTDPKYRQRNIGLLSKATESLNAKAEKKTDRGTVIKIEFAPVINCASGNGVDIMQALKSRMPEFVDMITRAIESEREGAY